MTETLAELSNNAIYSATVVYALAMLAHVVEWAMAHTLPATVTATSRDRATPRDAPHRRVVPAGGGPGRADTHAGTDTSAAGDNTAADVAIGADRHAATATAADTTGVVDLGSGGRARGAPTAATPAEVERSDKFGRIGLSLTVLGMLLHAVGVVTRGIAAGRVPWGSMYEFTISCSLAVAAAYVFLVRRYHIRWLGLLVTGFLLTVLGVAVIVLYRPVAPVVPALHSYWLMIHVSAAAIAGGAFTVGALASVLYLVRSTMETRALAAPDTPRTGFLWRTPSAADIDRLSYRVHAFAFPLWTFAVLAGAIWAEYAWGRYWGWDPKEVWAFITWVVYAAYLHARATAGWQGRAAAYVALFGYTTFIFNFVGINLFGSGLHAYSGM